MIKVVINECYGGFGLSSEALAEYCRRKGVDTAGYTDNGGWFEKIDDESDIISASDIPRHDPDLVAVVEDMRSAANGSCASLVVVSIGATRYLIRDYDGFESVVTPDTIGDVDWVDVQEPGQ